MFGMRAALIVEHEVLADAGARIADAVVGMQIDLLVLDACRRLVRGFWYTAAMSIVRIGVATCLRPMKWPSPLSKSRIMRLPANGCSRCSSSMRRITPKSAPEVGRGR